MRRIIKFLFQLFMALVLMVVLTGVWIVVDGLNDLGDKADVGLVMSTPEAFTVQSDMPLLDRTVKLFNDGCFLVIIVSGTPNRNGTSEPKAMAKYLETKGVPESAIVQSVAENTPEAVRKAGEIIKDREFKSVMVVTDYYHVTRTKLALIHDGITSLQKAHVGVLNQNDAFEIGREVVALHTYVAQTYVLPTLGKIKDEAVTGAEKMKGDAEEAKKKVDKGLDSAPK